ncbi:hypothetical protein APICC_01954 [Apis cerana cerana]|uniref:Uncharacterized protein n=1 Tax=Apis cerana cerana TaxID=94128 RepID=A0A2A3EMJ8_APICC|nr:hypothetical protein APICC_01954 [Apis cerana cerana]
MEKWRLSYSQWREDVASNNIAENSSSSGIWLTPDTDLLQEPSPTYIPADTGREVSHLVPGNLLGIKLFLGREYVCEFHKCWSPEGLAYCFAPVVWPSWRAVNFSKRDRLLRLSSLLLPSHLQADCEVQIIAEKLYLCIIYCNIVQGCMEIQRSSSIGCNVENFVNKKLTL